MSKRDPIEAAGRAVCRANPDSPSIEDKSGWDCWCEGPVGIETDYGHGVRGCYALAECMALAAIRAYLEAIADEWRLVPLKVLDTHLRQLAAWDSPPGLSPQQPDEPEA